MQFKIMTLKYSERLSGFETDEIEDFVKDKEIMEVRDHFFMAGGSPRLTIIFTYTASEYPKEIIKKKTTENYKNYLSDEDWPLFKTLKEWRNAYAKTKGVPPYILFDNAQLAQIAHNRPQTKTDLMKIDKIGRKKADDYWEDLNRFLQISRTEMFESKKELNEETS